MHSGRIEIALGMSEAWKKRVDVGRGWVSLDFRPIVILEDDDEHRLNVGPRGDGLSRGCSNASAEQRRRHCDSRSTQGVSSHSYVMFSVGLAATV